MASQRRGSQAKMTPRKEGDRNTASVRRRRRNTASASAVSTWSLSRSGEYTDGCAHGNATTNERNRADASRAGAHVHATGETSHRSKHRHATERDKTRHHTRRHRKGAGGLSVTWTSSEKVSLCCSATSMSASEGTSADCAEEAAAFCAWKNAKHTSKSGAAGSFSRRTKRWTLTPRGVHRQGPASKQHRARTVPQRDEQAQSNQAEKRLSEQRTWSADCGGTDIAPACAPHTATNHGSGMQVQCRVWRAGKAANGSGAG